MLLVLQEPICYGIVWGAAGADLLRHFLWSSRSRSVTALFVVPQEPICYGIVCGTSGADLLRHCSWYCRSRSVTALFVVLQEPSATGGSALEVCATGFDLPTIAKHLVTSEGITCMISQTCGTRDIYSHQCQSLQGQGAALLQ